ncbi:LytR C-terminal domain-containing protein [Rathayibacter sp. YIM 133350]|uniref:LytR C-terminal domain-containing protein n=1 Tax=Rathayibacter sp. YIM 133350 TaxID=3131992 RepID=UPI00307F5BB6
MATSTPKDRFDEFPNDLERVGAHRAPRRRGRGWVVLGWAALATVVLIVIGAVGILWLNNGLDIETPLTTSSATPTASGAPAAAPTTDPSVSVTVLNGTTTEGLAGTVADILRGQGWNVGATSNADSSDIAKTRVYYADAGLEGAARGAAAALPGADVALSQDFAQTGAQLVVVIGTDYSPPAA